MGREIGRKGTTIFVKRMVRNFSQPTLTGRGGKQTTKFEIWKVRNFVETSLMWRE